LAVGSTWPKNLTSPEPSARGACRQCAPAARVALPAEVEADQLPHGIETQAAGHDRIAFEVASEEPEIRVDIQLGDQLALAILAAHFTDVNDTIDHQHVRRGQLRITGTEEFAAAATKQVFPSKGVLFGHAYSSMGPAKGFAAYIPGPSSRPDHQD